MYTWLHVGSDYARDAQAPARDHSRPGDWTIVGDDYRDLGRITEAVGFGFFIYAPRGSRLHGIDFGPYPTLADALQRIGSRMEATCVLSAVPAPNATALG